VLPPAQFLKRYTFYTDVSYATTYLVVTRRKTATGMKDVRVGCLGVLGDWKSAGSTDEYTVATLKSGGGFVGGCHDGLQTAESDGPFGVTVWGLDTAASYAYPAGGNVERINQVTVPTVPR
jgi:hypothetical protein